MNTDSVSAMSHLSTHETVGKLALPVAGLVDHALIKGTCCSCWRHRLPSRRRNPVFSDVTSHAGT